MGCDINRKITDTGQQLISIHAPAWGATLTLDTKNNMQTISIHAPAWGATGSAALITAVRAHFNPRTRMGCDGAADGQFAVGFISIHAPAWGATRNP